MAKLTKAQIEEQNEALDKLRGILTPGATVAMP